MKVSFTVTFEGEPRNGWDSYGIGEVCVDFELPVEQLIEDAKDRHVWKNMKVSTSKLDYED